MNLHPLLSNEKMDAKSLIVEVLAKEFPLSAKQVYNNIRKQSPSSSLTYQAVHKALKQLEAEKVVNCANSAYSLSEQWIKGIEGFSRGISSAYSVGLNVSLPEIEENRVLTLNFGLNVPVVHAYYWMLGKLAEARPFFSDPPRPVIASTYAWPLTVLSEKEFEQFQTFYKNSRGYYVTYSDTSTDQALLKFWERFGFQVKSGVELPGPPNADYMVQWNYVFHIKHTKRFLDKVETLYRRIEKEGLKDFSPTHDVAFGTGFPITVVITRDSVYAENIRSQVSRYFSK